MTSRVSWIVRLGGLAAALGACAGVGTVTDEFDPANIRVITPTSANAGCLIGRRATPLCAVEIQIACINKILDKTCAGERAPNNVRHRQGKDRVEYVIVKSGFANPDKVRSVLEAERKKHPDLYDFLVDGVFQAHVLERACPTTRPNCEGVPWSASLYNVGPHGKPPDTWASGYALIYHPSDWFVD